MGRMEDLATEIEKKVKEKNQEEINLDKIREDWLDDLNLVFTNIKEWLKPLGDRVTIIDKDTKIKEDKIGEYKAPLLVLEILGTTIKVVPRGTFIVGSKGRIDFSSVKGFIMIVKHDDDWVVADKKDHGFEYEIFDKETLAEIIEELI